jgi:hypothetical protein
VRMKVKRCDLGLNRAAGTCSVDTSKRTKPRLPLGMRARAARALAGLGFHGLAVPLQRTTATRPLALAAHWFGASHLTAAASGYPGCPELGAIPSVLAGREIATECGPWEWIDSRLNRAGK